MTSAPVSPRADRGRSALAFGLAAYCLLGTVATVWANAVTAPGGRPEPLDWPHWGSALSGLPLALAGAALATRLPRHTMTWLLLATGTVAVTDGAGAAYATWSLLEHGGDLPFTALAVFVGARFGPMINMAIPALVLFFPDGTLPSRRWRWPVRVALGAQALGVVALLTIPWRVFSPGPVPPVLAGVALDPLTPPLPDWFWPLTIPLCRESFVVAFVLAVAAFVVRFRGAGPVRRAQLRWMLLAVLLDIVLVAAGEVVAALGSPAVVWWVGDALFVLLHAVLAVAIMVAVARYRLYDVDLLLGWTLLYAGVAAAVVAVDMAVFVGVGTVFDDPLAAVLAAGVVAVVYGPLRLRLQRVVNRVLTGRGEPYEVVSALARRLEETVEPDELLLEVARVVAASFRSPYVRVELDRADGRTTVVEHGRPRADAVVLPFGYRGAPIGRLALVPRTGPRSSDADQRLLADVVRQAAAAARATALTEELRRSREQLVTRIAEERRRLRRDLHDGLGPSLAAAALKIEAARNLAPRDAGAADGTLREVRGDLAGVLADVRRLVHDLRPPSLDRFGLAGAVERQADRFRSRTLRVTVGCSGDLGALPAAAEEAAYRIVGEALANVSRHARAGSCAVRLSAGEDALEVEVVDDGRGVPASAPAGVGLVGMRERAEELGGDCAVTARPGGGTSVRALLPYRPRAHGNGSRR
ncbi:sensor histidine kinase [Actinomadura hibisca]|uniref:sensor histidine kinase n=1 Tax=Actinomadura hibisca TaxID=68565 RepID=UPI000B0CF8A7|nr:sensor histidine kinase [Actinomadura hibisca]